ncbi:MAG: amidohydrolase [Spirochaetales bacterium]|nr:amidohydrolase [Spirochaetales bacterium]
MADLFIKNALVMTCEPDVISGRVIENGGVVVDGDKIIALGKTEELEPLYGSSKKVINAAGKIVFPGFIITHTHMPYVMGHNQPVDFSQLRSFWDMLQKMGWEWLEDLITRDGIYASTRYAAAKMLKSGTTTVCELVEAPNDLEGALEASCAAIEEIGIRAQLGYEVTERVPGKSILDCLDKKMAERGFEENIRIIEKYPKGSSSLIMPRLGVHTAYTNSLATLKKAREIADEYGCGIQIHIAEIPRAFLVEKYGKSAPMLLEEAGLLGPDVVAAHCIDIDDEDLNILARNGVNVAHTPMTNSLGGNGVARVPEMMEAGINVSLGHDCFFTLDTAEYIRYTYLIHKAHNANPALMPPFVPLDFALGNAAKALGMKKSIGSLAEGKKADILIIKPDCPTPVIPASVMSYFTMTFLGKDVESVIVDGKLVVEDFRLKTGNEDEIMQTCVKESALLWARNEKI